MIFTAAISGSHGGEYEISIFWDVETFQMSSLLLCQGDE
jgi:hypothetical protein